MNILSLSILLETPHSDTHNNEELSNFMKEALVMKGLAHPNIVKLVGVALFHHTPHVVLEYMDLGDLKAYVACKARV